MPVNFNWVASDATLANELSSQDRLSIKVQQKRVADWTFEFHEGHITGNPVYIRPAGCKVKSNLTKMDTKNIPLSTYLVKEKFSFNKLANPEHVISLQKAIKDDMDDVITANYGLLQTAAKNYYEVIDPNKSTSSGSASASAASAAPPPKWKASTERCAMATDENGICGGELGMQGWCTLCGQQTVG